MKLEASYDLEKIISYVFLIDFSQMMTVMVMIMMMMMMMMFQILI